MHVPALLVRPTLFATLAFLYSGSLCSASPVESVLEKRQRNVVIQKWDLSCGAAALATLLRFQHGDDVTEREIALSLMRRPEYIADPTVVTRREGFSLKDLKSYVTKRGYIGQGLGGLNLEHLTKLAPLIVPIRILGYNHFVIFRGIRANRVLLADPAWGNRTMITEDFVNSWIRHPGIGHVGFTVSKPHAISAEHNKLAALTDEFVFLR
jgi:predicted double-glycine peptidase